jgi:hypothetical protein
MRVSYLGSCGVSFSENSLGRGGILRRVEVDEWSSVGTRKVGGFDVIWSRRDGGGS